MNGIKKPAPNIWPVFCLTTWVKPYAVKLEITFKSLHTYSLC